MNRKEPKGLIKAPLEDPHGHGGFRPQRRRYARRAMLPALIAALTAFACLAFAPSSALAACTTPGTLEYFSDDGKFKYCDGTKWVELGGGSDTLSGLSCATGQVASWNGASWACADQTGGSGGTALSVNYTLDNDTGWTHAGSTLPGKLYSSQVVVIGEHVYLFGGHDGSGYTNAIYRAPVSNPASWRNTGKTLPGKLGYSQAAVIGDHVYLFGGYDNSSRETNVIYRAPVSDPTNWSNTGSTLPSRFFGSQAAVIGEHVYLFGGFYNNSDHADVIYRAPVSDPTNWSNTGRTLPGKVAYSQVMVIGDYVYLFGGDTPPGASGRANVIYRAPVSDPTNWSNTGSTLPSGLFGGQAAVIGEHVYLFGGRENSSRRNTNVIYRAPVSDPTNWSNTGRSLPGKLAYNQAAVIGEHVYLFGGYDGSGRETNVIYRAPIAFGFSTANEKSPALTGNRSWKVKANIGGGTGGGSDTLSGLSCATGQVVSWNGASWACADQTGGSGNGLPTCSASGDTQVWCRCR